MTDKVYLRIAIGWALFLLILNLLAVPFLAATTSGGEQAPFTFIAISVGVLIVGQLLLLIIYSVFKTKKHSR
jgi:hypothetical protein